MAEEKKKPERTVGGVTYVSGGSDAYGPAPPDVICLDNLIIVAGDVRYKLVRLPDRPKQEAPPPPP